MREGRVPWGKVRPDDDGDSSRSRSWWFAAMVFTILSASDAPAFGGTNVWTTNGPQGAAIGCMVLDPMIPAIVYADGLDGVFKSSDGGLTWESANDGLDPSDMAFFTMAINPQDPSTLYFASGYDGIFKSTNGGASWTQSNILIDFILTVTVDPSQPLTVYAGTESSGVWKSTDGALTWSKASRDVYEVQALAVDPSASVLLNTPWSVPA